jgi:deoxyribonuclease IV
VLLGAHCSGGVKKALDRAAELEVDSVQLFVQSPRTWRFPDHDPKDLAAFAKRRKELGIGGVLVHSLYLVNLASTNEDFYDKSVKTMRSTVKAACAIEAEGVVFHVGSHQGAGFEAGLELVVPALQQVVERCSDTTWLLLENSAGAGGTIGRSIEELAALYDALDRHPRLGVCLDSCHLWVSGYDVTDRGALDALLDELDDRIGLDRLRALHVNDAQAPLGSNRDRHANILEGLIGEKLGVFLGHPKLQGLPAVLEVAGKDNHGPDEAEMAKLRELHARWTNGASSAGRRRGKSGGRRGARKTRG